MRKDIQRKITDMKRSALGRGRIGARAEHPPEFFLWQLSSVRMSVPANYVLMAKSRLAGTGRHRRNVVCHQGEQLGPGLWTGLWRVFETGR